MSKKDFLSILKIRNSGTNADNLLRSPHELRVQVTPAYTKGAQIAIVDKKGVKQSPGDYSREGVIGSLLRTLSDISGQNGMNFRWMQRGKICGCGSLP